MLFVWLISLLFSVAYDSDNTIGSQTGQTVSADSTQIVNELLSQAVQHRRNREFSKALEILPVIISYGERHEDLNLMEWGYLLSGHAYLGLLKLEEAEEFYRKTLAILDEDNLEGQGMIHNNLGNLFRVAGEYEKSVEYLKKSIHYNSQIPDNSTALAINYVTIAQNYTQSNQLNLAIEYNNKAQLTYKDQRKDILYLSILNISGRLAEQMGFFDMALINFQETLEVAEEINSKAHVVDSYFNIGNVYFNMQELDKAQEYYELYLPFLTQMEGQIRWNRYMVISNFFSLKGDHERAKALHAEAEKASANADISLNKVLLLRNKGQILRRAGHYDQANKAFLSIFNAKDLHPRDVMQPLNYWEKVRNLFHIDRNRAFELSETAIRETERERREIGFGSSVTSGFYSQYYPYFVMLAQEYARDENFSKASDFLEMARSRAFKDDLLTVQADFSHTIDAKTRTEIDRVTKELYELEQEMLSAQTPSSSGLELKRNQLERRIHVLTDQAYRNNPGALSHLDMPAKSIREAQTELSRGQAILQFAISPMVSFALLTTPKEHFYHEIDMNADEIATLVRELRANIENQSAITDLQPQLDDAGAKLLGNLPIATIDELLVISDGSLHYMPIDLLRIDDAYLIENTRVHYIPSLTVRQILQQRGSSPNNSLLAVVNPDFGTQHTLSSYVRTGVRPLPYSALEGRLITSNYPESVDLYAAENASEQVIKEKELQKYRIIHLATHGILDDYNPRFSGILLSNPENPTALDDGFLRVGEMYDLKLDADLVVLSACNTGLGKIFNGEGVMGFQRAFMYAGARSVAVSLWNVYDRSTAMLMRTFYAQLSTEMTQRNQPDYARALHAAKLELLKNSETAHPVHWAPFILYGF